MQLTMYSTMLQACFRQLICCLKTPCIHKKQTTGTASPASDLCLPVTGLTEVAVSEMCEEAACRERPPAHVHQHMLHGITNAQHLVPLATCASDRFCQSVHATPSNLYVDSLVGPLCGAGSAAAACLACFSTRAHGEHAENVPSSRAFCRLRTLCGLECTFLS